MRRCVLLCLAVSYSVLQCATVCCRVMYVGWGFEDLTVIWGGRRRGAGLGMGAGEGGVERVRARARESGGKRTHGRECLFQTSRIPAFCPFVLDVTDANTRLYFGIEPRIDALINALAGVRIASSLMRHKLVYLRMSGLFVRK